jgi:hypothetical protein
VVLPHIRTLASSVSARMMNFLSGGPSSNPESLRDVTMRKLIDYLDPLKKLIDSVGPVADRVNAYQEARLAIDAAIASMQDMHGKYVTPALETLSQAGASLNDLHTYLYALHAEERNRVVGLRNEHERDKNGNITKRNPFLDAVSDPSIVGASGWSTNHANSILARLRAKPNFAAIQQAGQLYRQMLDENLLDMKNAGLISQDSYDQLTTQWKNYVPLHAEEAIDEKGSFQPGSGRGFDVRGKEYKGATGRFTEAENIPAWAVSISERSKLRQQKNKVFKSLLRFINQFDPSGANGLAEVYWSGDPTSLANISKAPTVYKRELDKNGKVVNKAVPYSVLTPEILAGKVAGKNFYIKFNDERVGAALKNLNSSQMNLLLRLSRVVTTYQSIVNTRINPEFISRNFFRDALTALVHLEGFSTKQTAKVYSSIPEAWGPSGAPRAGGRARARWIRRWPR